MPGVPGKGGGIPKRSDQRVRRNKDVVEIDTISMQGEVEVPELGIDNPHPIIEDFWDSLPVSGQTQYWEPSDWQFARVALHFLNAQIKASRPSGQILATVNSMLTDMLVSEGARRRVRMEVERNANKPEGGEVVDVAAMFRQRMEAGG